MGLILSAGIDLYHYTSDDVHWHLHAWEGDNSNDCVESNGQVGHLQNEVDLFLDAPKFLCCTEAVKMTFKSLWMYFGIHVRLLPLLQYTTIASPSSEGYLLQITLFMELITSTLGKLMLIPLLPAPCPSTGHGLHVVNGL